MTTATQTLIPGYYALYHKVEDRVYHFKLDMPTEGRWAGYTFLSHVAGGNKGAAIRGTEKGQILNAIRRNPIESAALYGKTTGTCGICHRTLTVKESVERGIGPVCLKKLGG